MTSPTDIHDTPLLRERGRRNRSLSTNSSRTAFELFRKVRRSHGQFRGVLVTLLLSSSSFFFFLLLSSSFFFFLLLFFLFFFFFVFFFLLPSSSSSSSS